MDLQLGAYVKKNKRKSAVLTSVLMVLFVLLLLWPFLTLPDPPPGQEGILVNLGIPDVGQGDENAPEPTAEVEEPTPQEEVAPPVPEVEVEVEEVPEPPKPEPKPEPTPQKEVVQTEDPAAIALRKKKERERQERIAEEREDARKKAEARKKREAEAEAKRVADAKAKAEAERKAAAAAKAAAAKEKYSGAFGGGEGEGKGNTGKPGNQGDPNGDPNSDILSGISVGKGRVGGGLGGRGVRGAPDVTDKSQKTGTVVIYVCVDSDGNVTSAKYQLGGSSTQDPTLVRKATSNAKRWKFSKGAADKQCGTIKYEFKVK